jgi:DNA-binding transcriptional MerR regulator
MNTEQRFSLDDLARLLELPKRTIRFYIQENLVDRPQGVRRGAFYTQLHLDQLLEIRKWQRAGLSLERIKELLGGGDGGQPLPPVPRRRPGDISVRSHIQITEGVELEIDPKMAGLSPEQIRLLSQHIIELVGELGVEKEKHE